jgi:hypothetical protein
VALLERHSDFGRTFRGDGLQPGGIDAFKLAPRDSTLHVRHARTWLK